MAIIDGALEAIAMAVGAVVAALTVAWLKLAGASGPYAIVPVVIVPHLVLEMLHLPTRLT